MILVPFYKIEPMYNIAWIARNLRLDNTELGLKTINYMTVSGIALYSQTGT